MSDEGKPRDPIKDAIRQFDKRTAHLRPAKEGPTLALRSGADIPITAPEWAWNERLVRGELNLIEGDQMMGKTTVAIELGARVSRGEPMPFDLTPRPAQCVLFFSPEEDVGRAGLPRFIAAGGARERFFEVRRVPNSPVRWQMEFPRGATILDATLTKMAQDGNAVGMLIIDGLSVILEDGKSENSNNDVKAALTSLVEVTRKHGVTVIGLRHLGKSKDSSPIHRGVGSIGFGAIARSQWAAVPHPENPNHKLLAPLKWSYAKAQPRSLVFELASQDVALEDGGTRSFGVCRWLDECDITAREAFEAASKAAKGQANPKQVAEAASAIEAAFAELEAEANYAPDFSIPESILKDAIVKGYRIPGAAYYEAKHTLLRAKKFHAKPIGGVFHIRRWRTQYERKGGI